MHIFLMKYILVYNNTCNQTKKKINFPKVYYYYIQDKKFLFQNWANDFKFENVALNIV